MNDFADLLWLRVDGVRVRGEVHDLPHWLNSLTKCFSEGRYNSLFRALIYVTFELAFSFFLYMITIIVKTHYQ